MKFSIISMVVFFLTFCYFRAKQNNILVEAKQVNISLSLAEKDLLDKLFIDYELGLEIKGYTNNQLEGLYKHNWIDDKKSELKGIKSVFEKGERSQVVKQLWKTVEKEKYKIFSCGGYGSEDRYFIAAVKTTDKYELFRVQETNGINHELSTEHIIEFLRKWGNTVGLSFPKVEYDSFTILFENLDFDLEKFSEECIEICPEFLTGFENAKDLERYIKRNRFLDFWWD